MGDGRWSKRVNNNKKKKPVLSNTPDANKTKLYDSHERFLVDAAVRRSSTL